jgi:hypothetical protein
MGACITSSPPNGNVHYTLALDPLHHVPVKVRVAEKGWWPAADESRQTKPYRPRAPLFCCLLFSTLPFSQTTPEIYVGARWCERVVSDWMLFLRRLDTYIQCSVSANPHSRFHLGALRLARSLASHCRRERLSADIDFVAVRGSALL